MKKSLSILALSTGLAFSALGQSKVAPIKHDVQSISLESNVISKTVNTGWYNYGRTVSDAFAADSSVNYYYDVLYPDSNVYITYGTTTGYRPWLHSIGQVFDPVAPRFDDNMGSIETSDSYYVDSVGIYYGYTRIDSLNLNIPDTLLVQIYEDDALNKVADLWGNGANSGAITYYDYTARKGAGPSSEFVYLLENKDTVNPVAQSFLSLPIEQYVGPDKKFGVVFTFFPGGNVNEDDTLVHEANEFNFYFFADSDQNHELNFYNNGLYIPTDVRYNNSSNGWNGTYLPGVAYTNHLNNDISFHISSAVAVNELNENISNQVSPNPVLAGENVKIKFNNTLTNAKIELIDITGKTVITNSVNGVGATINTHNLSKGSYFIKVSAPNYSSVEKLIIN